MFTMTDDCDFISSQEQEYRLALLKFLEFHKQNYLYDNTGEELPFANFAVAVLSTELFGLETWDYLIDYQLVSQSIRVLKYLNRLHTGEDRYTIDIENSLDLAILTNTINLPWFRELAVLDWSDAEDQLKLNETYRGYLSVPDEEGVFHSDFQAIEDQDLNYFVQALVWLFESRIQGKFIP